MKWPFRKEDGAGQGPAVTATAPADSVLRELYRVMFQARCVDETEAKLVARGEAFFHVSGAGHEATAVLNCFLQREDYLHLHYRDKALMLGRGVRPVQFFHNLLCNAESHSQGRQMCAHLSDPGRHILSIVGPVGNNALQAVGVASVLKAQDPKALVVCSMGDGSSQQGEVLEAIAEAVRAQLPVLFFIQDNQYAISTRTKGQTFYSRPDGEAKDFYGLPIHRVDGRDPVAAWSALGPIVSTVRAERKPALVVFEVERLCNHTNADDERRYRSDAEIKAAAETGDPLKHLARHLAKLGTSARDLEVTTAALRADIEAAAERALATWTAPPALEAKKPLPPTLKEAPTAPAQADTAPGARPSSGAATVACKPASDSAATPPRSPVAAPEDGRAPGEAGTLTMLEAMREVLRRHLAADERVILLGEDIEDPKGDVFGVTRGLTKAFPGRVVNSALSESTIVGVSIGRALAGARPVAFIQFADFLPLALNQILCELGTMYWRTAGGWECPVIIMAPCGGFRPGLGPFHAQTMEALLAHAPGLDVFMPSNATDAAGLLNAAFESGRPTVFLYPKVCLNAREHLASAQAPARLALPGKARFLSSGADLTLVTWGATVPICRKVADTLASARVSVDLIDLCSISPWDREAVCESAEKTGALVVVHEDNLTAGFGAEILAAVAESVPKRIASRRITRPDTYVPCRFANQLEVLPSFKRIMAGVTELLGLELGWTSGTDGNGEAELVKAIGSSPADRTVTIVAWKVKPGDAIAAGEIIAETESDKAVSELACPSPGTVEELLVTPGNQVPVGTPVMRLRPLTTTERLSPTFLLQRGEPIVKRKERTQRAAEKAVTPQPRSAKSLVGLSAVSAAEGSLLISNDALAARFPNRTAEEVFRLTGIETRRHLADNESVLDLATAAARKALAGEGLSVGDLDAIICSTTTPVEVTPSMACALQARLCDNGTGGRPSPGAAISDRAAMPECSDGASPSNAAAPGDGRAPCHAVAYDILAACSGFLYALSSAFDFLQTRPAAKVMVVTAEALSKVVNREDFDTAILFGDAATAVILYGASNLHRAKTLLHRPVVAAKPDPERILCVPNPGSGFVEMQGKKVFGEAVRTMIDTLERACAGDSLKLEDLNLIIPHQANGRIIEAVRSRLGASGQRVVNQVRHRGNTSSCTIPLCLAELDGQLKSGNRLGLCAFGGGFTFGAAVLEVNHAGSAKQAAPAPHSGSFAITAEAVIPNTVVVDVTDDPEWMERARWLTAEAYVALADPKFGIGLEDVYDVVSADVYERGGRSRTFAALTSDPQTGCTKISGTVRVVLGKPKTAANVLPLDAMNFIQPSDRWPHERAAWTETEIAELGRFFIPARYRTLAMRRVSVDLCLAHILYEAVVQLVRKERVRILYAIMPPYVTGLLHKAEIPLKEINSRLKTEDPFAASVFNQFSLYWHRAGPKLYYFPDATSLL